MFFSSKEKIDLNSLNEKVTQIEEESNSTSNSDKVYQNIDLDLSTLSSTLVYSELFNLTNNPDEYIGKVIRIKGEGILIDYSSEGGLKYPSIYVADAAACCQQGVEYLLGDDTLDNLSDNYKINNEKIIVTGILERYTEDGMTYMHLVNAVYN